MNIYHVEVEAHNCVIRRLMSSSRDPMREHTRSESGVPIRRNDSYEEKEGFEP